VSGMSKQMRLPALVALSCLLTACMAPTSPAADATPPAAANSPAAAAPPPAPGPYWQVVVTQSGGFAGIEQRYTATSTSPDLAIFDVVRATTRSVPLSAAEKQELAQMIGPLAGGPDIDQRSASCRDCFRFEMTLSTTPGQGSKPRRIRYDSAQEVALPESRLIDRILALGRAGAARPAP
jgi:hypothetical protein